MKSLFQNVLWPWAMLRYTAVYLTMGFITWSYYSFSHYIHNFHFQRGGGNSTHADDSHHREEEEHGDHHHGRGGSFENIHLKQDKAFLDGLALPLLVLTVVSLVWNPITNSRVHGSTTRGKWIQGNGDVNVKKWTFIWFVVPLFLVMLDGAISSHHNSHGFSHGWSLYIKICMSLMSPSGYAATWALSLFLIPVTKHSPILDWLRVTPVQALAFHRITGWVGFWNSCLHGFLHLRHLMDVLNPQRTRKWYQQLKILLIPNTWQCFTTQNPWDVFLGRTDPLDGTDKEAQQCWLALVNGTGMISTLAYVLLAITSLHWVRRYSYTLFYSVHIPAAWIMLFNAIWHYPTCALILIPNILYYVSLNIPVYITQKMDAMKQSKEQKSSPLVEAKLLQGGSIELTFATSPSDHHRHENRFVKVSCPSISSFSHPFSVFSRKYLTVSNRNENTISLLLRPTGPFTTNLTRLLFPDRSDKENIKDDAKHAYQHLSESVSSDQSPPNEIQVDSYYAGSFDWVNKAILSHDKILMVAGGVGIVPFLEFLPALQEQMLADACNASPTDTLVTANSNNGPEEIHLHWYCREYGLASHVWNNYLEPHIREKWESTPTCQGRLKVYLHLTSAHEGDKLCNIFDSVPNYGLVDSQKYSTPVCLEESDSLMCPVEDTSVDHSKDAMMCPVKDANFTQSKFFALLSPGLILFVGTIMHWWWYKSFTINEKWSRDNLVIRSHSIILTIEFALLVCLALEHYNRSRDLKEEENNGLDHELILQVEEMTLEIESPDSPTMASTFNEKSVLTVSAGRPSLDSVTKCVLDANLPGAFMCGPHSLMECMEENIRSKTKSCVFYREDSDV